jgi:hypothetical protein
MLSTDALVTLVRESHDIVTLSVSIDGRVSDPAMRTRWRTELQNALDTARAGVPPLEREAFLLCETRLEQVLSQFDGAIGAPGFIAFVTPDQVRFAERVGTPMPTAAFWSRGARVAPYVRALEHERPVLAVIGGSREVRLYRSHLGTLERLEAVLARDARVDGEAPDRARTASDAGGHRNVRGATAADDIRRVQEASLHRLISDTVARITELAGESGWVVLGGAKDVVPRLLTALPRTIAERTLVHPGMRSKATLAEIRRAVHDGGTRLREAREQRLVSELVERAHHSSRATVGLNRTKVAIELGAVEELLVTATAWAEHPREVEQVISGTLLQGGIVEHVEGSAARQLDAEAGGVGALLRFAAPPQLLPDRG